MTLMLDSLEMDKFISIEDTSNCKVSLCVTNLKINVKKDFIRQFRGAVRTAQPNCCIIKSF